MTGLAAEPDPAPSTAPGTGAARGASAGVAGVAAGASADARGGVGGAAFATLVLEIDSAGVDEFLQPANITRLATSRRNVISRQYVTAECCANRFGSGPSRGSAPPTPGSLVPRIPARPDG